MDWEMISIWEWQVMTALTFFSAVMSWFTKKRTYGTIAIGGIATLIIALALWEPIRPVLMLVLLPIGTGLLVWMAKRILEPNQVQND